MPSRHLLKESRVFGIPLFSSQRVQKCIPEGRGFRLGVSRLWPSCVQASSGSKLHAEVSRLALSS